MAQTKQKLKISRIFITLTDVITNKLELKKTKKKTMFGEKVNLPNTIVIYIFTTTTNR